VNSPPASIDTPYPQIEGKTHPEFEVAHKSDHISFPLSFKVDYRFPHWNAHSFFAYNQQGEYSVPLIVFPSTCLPAGSIYKGDYGQPEMSSNGDLNQLSMFINWIKRFAEQLKKTASSLQSAEHNTPPPNIFLLSSFIYIKLSFLTDSIEKYEELNNLLIKENIELLFYPVGCAHDQINAGVFRRLHDMWSEEMCPDRVETDYKFANRYLNCLDRVLRDDKTCVSDSFNQLIELYGLSTEPQPNRCSPAAATTSKPLPETALCLSMNDWQTRYSRKVTNELQITNPNNLWTVEIMQFPYVIRKNELKEPEFDCSPQLNKPRVSVLFAFNAAGYFPDPFIVYPLELDAKDKEASSIPPARNEIISQNGLVTSRVFNRWLFEYFLPDVKQNQKTCGSKHSNSNILLLYSAKLDPELRKVQDANAKNNNQLNFFTLHESIHPLKCLFKVK
jgi:hypothetical protein